MFSGCGGIQIVKHLFRNGGDYEGVDMFHPDDLLYTSRHLWVRLHPEESQAEVGITDELQDRIPEITSIDMPMVGDELEMDSACVLLHLATSRLRKLHSPLTGRVLDINRDVLDRPELIHLKPYGSWLFRMEYDEEDELEMLMDAARYARYLDSL